MTAPTYVNAGARQTAGFASSIAPALPASLVNGNLLIAMVATNNADSRPFTFPAGWTTIDSNGSTNHPGVAYAGHIVDGTEGASITISWGTGNDSAVAKVWQFTGNLGTIGTAIGSTNKAGDTVGTTYTNPALTIASANSLVVNLWYGNNGAVTSPPPTNYTTGTSETNVAMFYETVASQGGSSTAISHTIPNMRWQSYEFEIESQPPEYDITVSMSLGFSQATTVDNSILEVTASNHGLGFDVAAAIQLEKDFSASPALGFSVVAGLIAFLEVQAAPALGFSVTTNVIAEPPPPQPVIIINS